VLFAARERLGETGRIVGIDVTPEMLARAEAEVERRSLANVELRQMDGEQLTFADATFDTVLCSFGLQAFVDARAALIGFQRVLRPGGRVGVVLPLGWPFECDSRWTWQEGVLRSFGCELAANDQLDRTALQSALQASGFTEISLVEVACPLAFRDAEEWWLWSWSHGTRSLFEQVSEDRLPALRAELFRRVQNLRDSDGRIHGSLSGLLARASKLWRAARNRVL
jgi:SAM-dependent methyltransferase